MELFLGFDIGNTNTRFGIYQSGEIVPEKIFSYETDRKTSADELKAIVNDFLEDFFEESERDFSIVGVGVSSVVPEINREYKIMSDTVFNTDLFEVNSSIELGMTFKYDNPVELGADRIANAVAAYKENKRDMIIIDLGTANTFCVVHANGIFDGGIIGPGIGGVIETLADKASQLVKVKFEKPEKLIATNMINGIKSGYFYGFISMVNGIITRIEQEYSKKFLIILTGGFSKIISNYIEKEHKIDQFLTMKGIKYLFEMNKKHKK